MGVGNFFGMLPEGMQSSRLYGVELDSIPGRIAQKLYPQADITVAGFETTDRRDFYDLAVGNVPFGNYKVHDKAYNKLGVSIHNYFFAKAIDQVRPGGIVADITVAGFETTDRRDFYDLAVGNVPFGNYKVNDKAYNKLGFSIHNYFFAKAIDQVRPGGIVAFVTSRYTLDSKDSTARKHIAERADLLGAIRLPNNAFKANAGTEVVSDIIFLQKRDRPADIEPAWVQLGRTEDGFSVNQYFVDHPEMVLGNLTAENTQYGREELTVDIEPAWVQLGRTEDGFSVNQYFVDHPEMVLGNLTAENTQYGREELTVVPIEGAMLADQLAQAVQHIEGQYTEVEIETPDIADAEAERRTLPADPGVKNFSYTVVDGEVYYRENSVMTQVALSDTAQERVKGMVELRQIVHE